MKLKHILFSLGFLLHTFSSQAQCDNPVNADFTISPDSIDSLTTFHFVGLDLDTNYHYWIFGDGDSSFALSPSHTYTELGTHEVCLYHRSECDTALACDSVEIFCPQVEANISEVHVGTMYFYYSTSVNATSYHWSTNLDTTTSSTDSFQVMYPWGIDSPCVFITTLMASNLCDTAFDYYHVENGYCFLNVESVKDPSSVEIFPNPTASVLNIKSEKKATPVAILDIQGRLLWKFDFSVPKSLLQLDVSQLENGTYFLQFEESGIVKNQRFIVVNE